MKVSKQKKREKLLKKIVTVSAISITVIAVLLSYTSFSVEKSIIVSEHDFIHKQHHNENDIETNFIENNDDIRKLKQELDEVNKLYTKKLELKEDKVRFVIEGDLISLYVTRGTLKDVIYAFVEQFDLDLNDYTDTFEDLTASKSFYLTGSLDTLVSDVLKKYGYDNFVLNSNPGDMHALITVFLFEPPDYDIAYSDEDNELAASTTNQSTGLVSKLLSKQAVVMSNSSNSLGTTTDNTALVEKSNSSQQAINIAEAKRLFEASENTIALGPDVDLSQGIPPEVQQQLSQLSKQVMVDAQGLTNALLNAEAQLKANQFTNSQ